MRIAAAYLDLMIGSAMIFAMAGTVALTQDESMKVSSSLKIPQSPRSHGSEEVSGSLMVTVRREGSSLHYYVEERPVHTLDDLVEHLSRIRPSRVVIALESELSVAELLPCLEAIGHTGLAVSLAYREVKY